MSTRDSENFVRPMKFWELFKVGFRILSQHMWLLVAINILPSIFIFAGSLMTDKSGIPTVPGFILILIGYVFQYLSIAMTLLIASDITLGRTVNLRNALNQARSSALFRRLLAASFWFIVLAAILLLAALAIDSFPLWVFVAVVLIVVVCAFFLMSCVAILEKRSGFHTVKRSVLFTFRNFGRIALSLLVMFLIVIVLPQVVLTPIVVADNALIILFLFVLYLFVTALVMAFQNLIVVLLYYEIRARKENYSEELLAQDLGYQASIEMMGA